MNVSLCTVDRRRTKAGGLGADEAVLYADADRGAPYGENRGPGRV
ncbi:hypothetical protein Slala03_71330 [Streptomyces lavendulae subsp. lavendulae]|nr:hypothetical protein Slala03_71330 [Streptomyces lavendulae subsp. lavendulae]